MKIVTATQMQTLDRRTIAEGRISGLTLMECAGTRVVEVMEQTFGSMAGRVVTILCGKGNNGGDGFVVGRLLRRKRARVQMVLLANPEDLRGDAKMMYRRFVRGAGHSAVQTGLGSDQVRKLLHRSACIVDALLGTGLSAPVTAAYRAAIEVINQIAHDCDLPVTAIDLPSGIHADTGEVMGNAVQATLTVTLGLPKLGLYIGPGIDHAGMIRIVDIGIPHQYVAEVQSPISLITAEAVRQVLPMRRPSSHKGTYGHAAIIAGSVGKTGAAALAAKAALRIGAGLVTVATPVSANSALEAKLLEAMTMPMPETDAATLASSGLDLLASFANDRSAAAVGPGLTTHPDTVGLIHRLIPRLEVPSVLDADALNALAGHAELLSKCKLKPVLTPHPGEMARLEGHSSAQAINSNRLGSATRFAQAYGVILLLKGARTIIARPDGHTAICPTGNAGMATAGTGDALTGIIVGLLAQRLDGWDASCAGAFLHGRAGDLAAADRGPAGMIAGDLIDRIPHALAYTAQQ